MKNTLLFICSTNILVCLLTINMKNCLTQKNPKMSVPILVTLLKMRPHYSHSRHENVTPSSSTSLLASYKEVPPSGLSYRPGGSYFPYSLLNEIQTMFSQLAKQSARVLPTDLCPDHVHYIKNCRSKVLRRNKDMVVQGKTVSHYFMLVIRKFIDFMSLFRHILWFSFSVKTISLCRVWNMQHIAAYS